MTITQLVRPSSTCPLPRVTRFEEELTLSVCGAQEIDASLSSAASSRMVPYSSRVVCGRLRLVSWLSS